MDAKGGASKNLITNDASQWTIEAPFPCARPINGSALHASCMTPTMFIDVAH